MGEGGHAAAPPRGAGEATPGDAPVGGPLAVAEHHRAWPEQLPVGEADARPGGVVDGLGGHHVVAEGASAPGLSRVRGYRAQVPPDDHVAADGAVPSSAPPGPSSDRTAVRSWIVRRGARPRAPGRGPAGPGARPACGVKMAPRIPGTSTGRRLPGVEQRPGVADALALGAGVVRPEALSRAVADRGEMARPCGAAAECWRPPPPLPPRAPRCTAPWPDRLGTRRRCSTAARGRRSRRRHNSPLRPEGRTRRPPRPARRPGGSIRPGTGRVRSTAR